MNTNMKITVIVPVYNVRKYLKRCVNSILNQSFPVFEVLLIDDGSTDGSGDLCELLTNKSKRIRVVHKKNAGLGLARNTGLVNLRDETSHVMFVDSDDWLEPGTVESYALAMSMVDADCSIGGFTKRDHDGSKQFEFKLENAIWTGQDLIYGLLPRLCGSSANRSDSIPMSVCSCMFSKDIIEKYSLRFPSEREIISEDFVFKFKYLSACKKVVTTDCVGYSYRTNDSSLTKSYRQDRFNASLTFYDYACRLVDGLPSEDDCLLRLKKTLFIYIKTCISQEIPSVSGKSRGDALRAIREMASDKRLLKVIEDYPKDRLGFAQRAFLILLRRRMAILLYAAAACGLM